VADTFTPDPTMYRMYMEFDGTIGGFTEFHNLGLDSASAAEAAALLILNWRQLILPTDMQITLCTIRLPGPPRDSIIVGTTYPLIGQYSEVVSTVLTPGSDSCNQDNDCISYRKQGALGSFSTCFLHGIPDSHVHKDVLTSPITMAASVPAIPTPPAATPLWETWVGMYLKLIQSTTKLNRVTQDPLTGNFTFSEANIARCVFRRVLDKKVGIPSNQQRGRRSLR
jgi:hypothetical protein